MKDKKINKKAEINFIKLKKIDSQRFIQILKEYFKLDKVINRKYRISHEDDFTFFPLIENEEEISRLIKTMENLIPFELVSRLGIENLNFKYKTLEEALAGKIPDNYQHLIPKSYDTIGNIAILEFKEFNSIDKRKFNEFKRIISQAVIQVNKNVRSVYEKKSIVRGAYRLREFAHLSGVDKTETIHRENNCVFKLDIKRSYFSPRLVYERRRVANSNIRENEVIVDMFSGVGPFSIQIAKLNKVKIHAFDVNSNAYKYLKKNIGLNKLKGEIFPYNMNIKSLVNPVNNLGEKLNNSVDRIIMNLPENSLDFIEVACFLMKKSGGILHFYSIADKPKSIEKANESLKKILGKYYWVINKIFNAKIVKSYSPKAELVVIDLDIKYLS
jgi:tRNA (guanine37-N1)-methyltransferase